MKQSDIILYPTETVYGLGVNAFDKKAWEDLCVLKGRNAAQTASWLVRDLADIDRLGVVTESAASLIRDHLPGQLTLVLVARDTVPAHCRAEDGTVSFRISADPLAQELITHYMEKNEGVPLTCTSANVHGAPTLETPAAILEQFGERADMITEVIDGGSRTGVPSTVVRCVGDEVEVLRRGAVELHT